MNERAEREQSIVSVREKMFECILSKEINLFAGNDMAKLHKLLSLGMRGSRDWAALLLEELCVAKDTSRASLGSGSLC